MNKTALIVLDGLGLAPLGAGNAISPESMPFLHELMERCGFASLQASGEAVGLDEGQAGNSEVGHLTIGAGRRIGTTLSRIRSGYETGRWLASPLWQELKSRERIHVVGLLSDAAVHAHYDSLIQTARLALQAGVGQVVFHLFLDGVDSPKASAPKLLDKINEFVLSRSDTEIGTISGRRWACDRSGDLSLTDVCVAGLSGGLDAPAFEMSCLRQHLQQDGGEWNFPFHRHDGAAIEQGDAVILCNHRADRMTQLAGRLGTWAKVYSLVELGEAVPQSRVFFPVEPIADGLVDTLNGRGIDLTRVAESCKFPHVTFFLNGMAHRLERALEIPSIPEAEIVHQPEMGAIQVCHRVCDLMAQEGEQALAINIANLDQVGHTGNIESTKAAATHVDRVLRVIAGQARTHGWSLVITADHGNADRMLDEKGNAVGSHSCNPVPLIVVKPDHSRQQLKRATGSISQVAPTFLSVCGLEPPVHMEESLI